MSTNGVSTPEDSEMADCDGEKVVTMMDVLQEQEEFEEDANAVLGASDDKNCTYAKGYIKRQAVYACMTCCADAKTDPTKRAGVCLACSLSCHENHELVELYTKRNFRCDCGNPKFNSNPCQFNTNKTDINEENKYNQNYSGVYCICNRPYPDPESTVEDEMIQCIVCEDWLHASHLDAVVPAIDQYAEMICKHCMEINDFIQDYSGLAVTTENVDIEVCDISISNVDTTNSEVSLNRDNENNVMTELKGRSEANGEEIKDHNDKTNTPITLEQSSSSFLDTENMKKKNIEATEANNKECEKANENFNITTNEISSDPANGENKDVSSRENQKYENSEDNSEKQDVINKTDNYTTNPSISENENDSNSGSNNILEKSESTNSEEGEKKISIKNINNETDAQNTNEIKKGDEDPENTNILSTQETNKTTVENKGAAKDKNSHVDTSTNIDNLAEITEKEVSSESIASSEQIKNNIESYENSDSKKVKIDSLNTERKDIGPKQLDNVDISNTSEITNENQLQMKTGTITENDKMNKERSTDTAQDNGSNNHVNREPIECQISNIKENKRKLSTEDNNDDVTVKKIRHEEEKGCVRPKGVTRHLKGATFWPSNFRQKLCTCSECLSMYKDLAVLFLIDTEDTVTAYETLGKERTEGNPSSQYEKGLQALSSLDRIQQINALTEYNKMRDKLVDFLKSFKDRKEIVKEEDIKAFFAGMKPKREPDGVYFCR